MKSSQRSAETTSEPTTAAGRFALEWFTDHQGIDWVQGNNIQEAILATEREAAASARAEAVAAWLASPEAERRLAEAHWQVHANRVLRDLHPNGELRKRSDEQARAILAALRQRVTKESGDSGQE